ncbi:cell division protein DamX [Scandinavium lactucae]|uniref:Cell division protein DamX n=1 Tax=Scandinavium lactucae TaxID=3095028 RepID=A0ABU4QQK4_9ENTR|nr:MULTISPECIES: cell division protein DamX [unclassified Scandinavium]MDX6039570.1 cell division protein DamX [Scandinavium sp. V105_6]MDX6049032.1 cell division protein DamX [Scandinavium sp. V105_1]
MDEFKPEDDLKPDPSDRRAGRSRQSSDRENDQQINFDDVDLDADERRPARTRKARDEREERAERLDEEEYYDSEEDAEAEEQVERRPRKRKKMPASKPASRQYIMMGVGILVLLLLIVGIGSALKAPSTSNEQASGDAKSIDLGANDGASADQANGAQPAPGATPANQTATNPQQDVSLPPISSTPTQGQNTAVPQGQQRVEVQGDLNNALTQQQGQLDGAVANSTLPTEPATVAPVRNGSAPRQTTSPAATTAPAATTRPERKHAVIEPKPQSKPQATAKATEPKPVAQQPKRTETAATSAPAKTTAPAAEPAKPAATKPAATTAAPTATAAATAPAATTPAATAAGKESGDVASLKGAPANHYTLQLSSSSNYDNLNNWARKEKIQKYVVYQTTRNGQPWYVLVSGTYATKDEAKRAVAALPADVQAKNPWAKPLHQVQSDLKQ